VEAELAARGARAELVPAARTVVAMLRLLDAYKHVWACCAPSADGEFDALRHAKTSLAVGMTTPSPNDVEVDVRDALRATLAQHGDQLERAVRAVRLPRDNQYICREARAEGLRPHRDATRAAAMLRELRSAAQQ
jgi:hypothetical protein